MTELRTARIRREVRRNVNCTDTEPSGPDAGFYCEEYTQGLLRVKPGNQNTVYELRVFSFENGDGNDWIEDVSERRSIPAGEPYVRMFRVGPADRMAMQLYAISGNGAKVDIFWTFS